MPNVSCSLHSYSDGGQRWTLQIAFVTLADQVPTHAKVPMSQMNPDKCRAETDLADQGVVLLKQPLEL